METPPGLADAAVAMAEAQLARQGEPESGTDGDRTIRPAAERRQLFVHLREEHIAGEASWRAELHDGTPLSGETFKRLACDSGLVAAVTDERSDLLELGQTKTNRLRTAAPRPVYPRPPLPVSWLRSESPAFLDAHHIEHRLDNGPTNKSNTTLLCHAHHLRLHEGGFGAERQSDGTLIFFDPDGRQLDPMLNRTLDRRTSAAS